MRIISYTIGNYKCCRQNHIDSIATNLANKKFRLYILPSSHNWAINQFYIVCGRKIDAVFFHSFSSFLFRSRSPILWCLWNLLINFGECVQRMLKPPKFVYAWYGLVNLMVFTLRLTITPRFVLFIYSLSSSFSFFVCRWCRCLFRWLIRPAEFDESQSNSYHWLYFIISFFSLFLHFIWISLSFALSLLSSPPHLFVSLITTFYIKLQRSFVELCLIILALNSSLKPWDVCQKVYHFNACLFHVCIAIA